MTEKTSDKYLLKSPSLLQEPKSMLHCKAPKIKILAKFFKYDSKYLSSLDMRKKLGTHSCSFIDKLVAFKVRKGHIIDS